MNLNEKMTYLSVLGITFRITPIENVLYIISQLIKLVLMPINILVMANFINIAFDFVANRLDIQSLFPSLAVIVTISIYNYILNPLIGLVIKHREIRTRLLLRVPFLEKIARLEYKHLENNKTVDLLNRIWRNPENQFSEMFHSLVKFIVMVGQTSSVAIILLVNTPLVGSMLILLYVPILFIALKAGKASYQAGREATMDQRYSWNVNWLLTARETVAERNLFNFSGYLSNKFDRHYEAARKLKLKVEAMWFVRSKSSAIILGLISAFGLFIMAPAVADGRLTFGLFITVQSAMFNTIVTPD